MITMKVKVISNLGVQINISNVSIKTKSYTENVLATLIDKFNELEPDKLVIESVNEYVDQFMEYLSKIGVSVDGDGYVNYPNKQVNEIEHVLANQSSIQTLSLKGDFRYNDVVNELLENGYIISITQNEEDFKVHIHDKL